MPVYRGMTHDGLGKYLKEKITKAPGETADIVQILKDTHTDVVVSYLPGRLRAGDQVVRRAGARGRLRLRQLHPRVHRPRGLLGQALQAAKLPIVGDDIKSQVGATIVHRTLARLFEERGVRIQRTSQLNVGGNMDFYNMLERERLESKKISKTNAVTSIIDHELAPENVHVGPSDYVPWLTDRKWAHIRVEGQAFGDVPLNLEMKLEVWDSPNSAGIVIDAVRCCKLALNHGVGGQLDGPSSYLMKSPHNQRPDNQARLDTEKFIAKYERRRPGARRIARRASPRASKPRKVTSEGAMMAGSMAASERFSIAHVTPYPWEAQENEVNAYVARVTRELSRAAIACCARPLALAGAGARLAQGRCGRPALSRRACSREPTRTRTPPTRAGRDRRRRGARPAEHGAADSDRHPPAGAAALPIDVARTIEELLSTVPLDFVHVHEPFAPSTSNAALRHSRSLNVGSFHAPDRTAALDARGAALRRELLRAPGRAHREPARHRRADGPPLPGRVPAARATERTPPRSWRRSTAASPRAGTARAAIRRCTGGWRKRPLIDVDLHMHTDHSRDCATPVEVLLATAREQGLGAIAVTDHNEISGALRGARAGR